MNGFDAAGLAGVAIILAAYAAAQLRRMDPLEAPALLCNLIGACLVLVSLTQRFNLAAFVMESCWALVALYGLARIVLRRRREP